MKYRGPLIVHASAKPDGVGNDQLENWYGVRMQGEPPMGGIVGIVRVVDCVRPHPSKWYQRGQFAIVLADPRPLPFTRWKGIQSLQTAPAELLRKLDL